MRFRRLVWLLATTALILPASPSRADDGACAAERSRGEALRQHGKLRDAIGQLAACASPVCPADIATDCGRRLADAKATVPTVVFAVTDTVGNDLPLVTVTVDGSLFAATLDGHPLPIDAGPHVAHFYSAGMSQLDETITIKEGDRARRVVVVLKPIPGVSSSLPSSPGGALSSGTVVLPELSARETSPRASGSASGWSTQKSLAVVSGVVGVAGLAIGSVFGALALSDASAVTRDCTATACSVSQHDAAASAHGDATTAGAVSTASFIVGGAALAGGLVLWLTAPSGAAARSARSMFRFTFAPVAVSGTGRMMLSGEF